MSFRLVAFAMLCGAFLQAQTPAPFEVEEATIAQVHDAMRAGRLTCRELVGAYLRRIEAYDKNGPAINSIVIINPDARKRPTSWIAASRSPASPDRCTACR